MNARTFVLVVVVISSSCKGADSTPRPLPPSAAGAPPPAVETEPIEARVGWITGECLAIANTSIGPDTPITVVSLDNNGPIVDGRVGVATKSAETCPPLHEDRRGPNESDWSFYELKLSAPVELGIGVRGETTAVAGGLDLNRDGAPERFTFCASSEGVWFHVWDGAPYQGVPLWSGYYYLGFDLEATCPE